VNWEKVFTNTEQIEIAPNNLNYLIGKNNFDDEFRFLLKENPLVDFAQKKFAPVVGTSFHYGVKISAKR
jgi:hypothetical protein